MTCTRKVHEMEQCERLLNACGPAACALTLRTPLQSNCPPFAAFRGMVEETATHHTTSKSGRLQKTVSAKVAASYLGRP